MRSPHKNSDKKAVGRTMLRNLLLVFCMFGFAFALVPLYRVFCDITGLNGRNTNLERATVTDNVDKIEADLTRLVRVQFDATNNIGMPWEFEPQARELQLHPGKLYTAYYHARNPTELPMIAQMVPSVSPGRAASYLRKTECFCFEEQVLQPGESVEMPVRFYVHRALPADVTTLTLSYTIFDVTPEEGQPALTAYSVAKKERLYKDKDEKNRTVHIHDDGSKHFHD